MDGVTEKIEKTAPDLQDESTRIRLHHQMVKLVNKGLTEGNNYKSVLDDLFYLLKKYIPFDRLGVAALRENGDVELVWMKSKLLHRNLAIGYRSPLKGSSLEKIAENKEPRIINDLEAFSEEHPESQSTLKALDDGIRSSLTFPIVKDGSVSGFLFFSSDRKNTFDKRHIELFKDFVEEFEILIRYGELKEEMVHARQTRQQFRDTMHELRSPLAIIDGFIKLLQTEPCFELLDTESQKLFDVLMNNVHSMLRLINELETSYRFGSQDRKLQLRKVDVPLFCEEIEAQSRVLASKKDMKIRFERNFIPRYWIFDAQKIQQVLNNLISNSIKFSFPGDEILISVEQRDSTLYFSVEDHGQGVPPQEISKLFQWFGKTSSRPTGGESSTGLGLAISKAIVDSHNGALYFDTKEGSGAKFSFVLPEVGLMPEYPEKAIGGRL